MSDFDTDNELTDAEMEDIVSELTEDDLRARSQKLHETQELYEELAYLANPKMPCPECTGAGNVSGGSLGDICVRCMGSRVLDRPGSPVVEMPNFAQLRASITDYGNAVADRALPPGEDGKPHRAFKGLALPAASKVVTMEEIDKLYEHGQETAKKLQGQAPAVEGISLNPPASRQGLLSDDGDLGDYSDADLDEMEADMESGD